MRLLAPGAPGGRAVDVASSLAIGELYILARHYLKLLFYASETAFFQGALAHAGIHGRARRSCGRIHRRRKRSRTRIRSLAS